jgi:phosphohistidine phosphatase SixA
MLVSGCAAANAGDQQPAIPDGRTETTVYVIRHAEKMYEQDRDPDLSERGRERADSLAVALRDSGVNIIITSNLKRTYQTAAPLARLRHISPKIVSIEGSVEGHVSRIAQEVKRHPGATILIVGHNNTVGKIVEAIGGGHIGDLCADEYSNLIIVSLEKGKPGKILLENYGLPDPPSPTGCPHLKDRY